MGMHTTRIGTRFGIEGSLYPSEATAEYLLKELVRQDKPRLRRESAGLQPYQCKFCQQWHLGH